MKNFEFEWKGKKYWYQRGIVTVLVVFCQDENGDIYVLTNKRGKGVPCNAGDWNCPCGHLDFDETIEECAVREAYEETGVKIDKNDIHLFSIMSKPEPGSTTQNVAMNYYCLLPGTINDYHTSKAHMEKDEVEEIKWMNLDDLEQYNFCFNHEKRILEAFEILKNETK